MLDFTEIKLLHLTEVLNRCYQNDHPLFHEWSIVLSNFYSKVLGDMLGGARDVGTDGI